MTPDFSTWIPVPSPNMFTGRKDAFPVSGLVMHFTAAGSGKGTAEYFAKEEVSWTENGQVKTVKVSASAHLVIDRDGTVYQCVNFADRAWHAGPATLWKGKPTPTNVNDFTIGIELANWGNLTKDPKGIGLLNYLGKPFNGQAGSFDVGDPKTFWETYPQAQMNAAIQATKVIISKYPAILRENVTGHENIQLNKHDPGPAFPWSEFLNSVYGYDDDELDLLNSDNHEDRS